MIQQKISLKKRLENGEIVIGTWCEIPSPETINILAKAGLDFVIIDMEHGSMDFYLAAKMVMAADADGCAPLIRVPRNDESDILRALEIAPQGLIVSHIESVEDRTKAISYIKFPPVGKRSLNPYTRAGNYRSDKEFTSLENKRTLSVLIIEGANGIKNIENIINDKNVDVVYIGAYDISATLGIPGDTKNPRVTETIKNLVKTIKKRGKIAGCLFHDNKELSFFTKIGIQFLCYKVDSSVLFDEFNRIKKLTK